MLPRQVSRRANYIRAPLQLPVVSSCSLHSTLFHGGERPVSSPCAPGREHILRGKGLILPRLEQAGGIWAPCGHRAE